MGSRASSGYISKDQCDVGPRGHLAKALARSRQLKDRFSERSEEYELATAIEEVIAEELSFYDSFEEAADQFSTELQRRALAGDAVALQKFLDEGMRRLCALHSKTSARSTAETP